MKKGTKIWLIVVLILALLGGGLCISAFAMGITYKDLRGMAEHGLFSFDSWWEETEKSFIKIEGDDTLFSEYLEESHHNEPVTSDFTKDYLYIDMDFGKIEIKSSNSDTVTLKCEDASDERYFHMDVTEDAIRVENQNHKLFGSVDTPEAVLYLPTDSAFQCVEIDVDAGSCQIEIPIQAVQLIVDVDAGAVNVNDMSVEWTDLDCDAGKIEFHGVTESGGLANVDAGAIKIELKDHSYEFYNYMLEVDAGSLKLNDHNYSGLDVETYIDHQAEADWTLDCDAGKIEMSVKE